MNKKRYITPVMEMMTMELSCMLAVSEKVNVFTEEKVDAGASLSNNHRDSWGNLWDDGE